MHSEDEVVLLHLDDIIPNRFQPREIFDDKALKELAVSIKEHGVIQPIIVRKIGNKYEIIAGERRYKASALAGLTKIPAIIRNLDDKESSKVALLENLQRRDLNPIEEARTYQKILEIDQMTQEELAKTMGKSQSAVANKLRLLSLSDEVQQALLKEQISERHARTLLNVQDKVKQKELLDKVVQTRMTVRELEQEIKGTEPETKSQFLENTPATPLTIPDNKIQLENQDSPEKSQEITPSQPFLANDLFAQSTPIETQSKEETPSQPDLPQFINYGEIDPDEEEEEEPEDYSNATTTAGMPIDITALKSNTQDITAINDNGKKLADLDSLLQIPSLTNKKETPSTNENANFKFFAPPEEKTSNNQIQTSPSAEINSFFGNAPTIPIKEPTSIETNAEVTTKPDIKETIEQIRKMIKDLEGRGVQIDSDEINFENSYQIVIKISKNN